MLREHHEPEEEADHSVAASLASYGGSQAEPPVTRPARVPASTYRLQISEDFDLFEATARLPYLHDLGVDWVYLSPLLAAEPGSTHGYDVVGFDRVDASRGGPEGLAALSAEARRLGMGVLVDIVPEPRRRGHARTSTRGGGTCSSTARTRCMPRRSTSTGSSARASCCVPVLGDDDLPVDDRPTGHLEVVGDELSYHDNRFPIAPGTSYGTPDEVHRRQHYELVSWRRGDSDLNYRRFFTVSTLAGVRVEQPEVFADTHVEVRRWFDEGLVDGLRVDHPDGLRDPEGYLDHLASLTDGGYTLVEKILEPGEELPGDWATDGTTGYDALALLDRVLTDPAGQPALDALESRLRGGPSDWAQLVHDRKLDVATRSLRAETRRIVRELPDLLPEPTERLEDAVAEVLACFPVYRSYLPHGRAHLDEAVEAARSHRPDLADVLDVLAPVLARPRPAGRAAVPADERDGDGQGRRGLRVLPVLAAHLAQRGRRRPEHLRDHARGVARGDGRPPARLAERDDHADHARHQARRGRAGPARRARGDPRPLGAVARPAAVAGAAARSGLRIPAVAGDSRCLAG